MKKKCLDKKERFISIIRDLSDEKVETVFELIADELIAFEDEKISIKSDEQLQLDLPQKSPVILIPM